jgi:hypothetical protein
MATLLHLLVLRRDMRGRSKRIIGLELDHRPHCDSHGGNGIFQRVKLREQSGLHAVPGLVPAPELIAERLNDVVRGDPDMGRASLNHLQ